MWQQPQTTQLHEMGTTHMIRPHGMDKTRIVRPYEMDTAHTLRRYEMDSAHDTKHQPIKDTYASEIAAEQRGER
jgi:hypothetical protein